jgi:hypothetical protein
MGFSRQLDRFFFAEAAFRGANFSSGVRVE